MHFQDLPLELLEVVAMQCPAQTINNLRLVNKEFSETLDKTVYKKVAKARYGVPQKRLQFDSFSFWCKHLHESEAAHDFQQSMSNDIKKLTAQPNISQITQQAIQDLHIALEAFQAGLASRDGLARTHQNVFSAAIEKANRAFHENNLVTAMPEFAIFSRQNKMLNLFSNFLVSFKTRIFFREFSKLPQATLGYM